MAVAPMEGTEVSVRSTCAGLPNGGTSPIVLSSVRVHQYPGPVRTTKNHPMRPVIADVTITDHWGTVGLATATTTPGNCGVTEPWVLLLMFLGVTLDIMRLGVVSLKTQLRAMNGTVVPRTANTNMMVLTSWKPAVPLIPCKASHAAGAFATGM